MSSRFKVQKVSESDSKEVLQTSSTKNDETPLNPANDSGSSTPDTSTVLERESKSLLENEKNQSNLDVEIPPPYTDEASGPKSNEAVASEGAGDGSKDIKGRFHVEFVDSKNDSNDNAISPPMSPNHDSVNNDTHSKTYYLRTFGHNTQEAIPMVAYYRNTSSVTGKTRPTLDQLHDAKDEIESPTRDMADQPDPEAALSTGATPVKFGWILGVLVRCLLNIFGVMLFLRLSWVVGQAGIGMSIGVILLSSVVTCITTLSMSAICTNGQVRGGGAYYLISRSLGPEFGGAIGLIFSLANAVGVALYVVGFSETVFYLMNNDGITITGNETNDIRIIGALTLVVLLGITQLGMAWESKAQLVLLFILVVAIFNFIIGTFINASPQDNANGFFNYQGAIAAENFGPGFRDGNGFFSVFSIFFPAATGILAGCNISGDLKDASKAIPKGTLLAILISTLVYCLIAVMIGCVEVRGASGNLGDYLGSNLSEVTNCTTAACQLGWNYNTTTCPDNRLPPCYSNGLLYDTQVMEKVSAVGPIIIAGIFAATLSSALASLVSAPKIFQAVCKDKIFPGIAFFAKGTPVNDEPRRGYALAFIVSLCFILIGELNEIADIISNFFLASYALINYSCFAASLSQSPGWRPSFKYYNMWCSLFGSLICCAIMFVIKWYAALATIVIIVALYKFVDYKKPDVNWGSSTQAYLYVHALNSTLKLQLVEDHVKNFRPQTLVLSGTPSHRPALVHFASQFTKNAAMMCCASVVEPKGKHPHKAFLKERVAGEKWLKQQKIKSFYDSVVSSSLKQGAASLMQSAGIGKLRTNTVLMGFKRDWREDTREKLVEYIDIIHDAFDLNYGVCILRLKQGLDVSPYLKDSIAPDIGPSCSPESDLPSEAPTDAEWPSDAGERRKDSAIGPTPDPMPRSASKVFAPKLKGGLAEEVNPQILKEMNIFQVKQDKGKTIDVWWLFDDGGLTILLPYLLSINQKWAGCHLRVFIGGKQSRIDQEKRTMAQLLSKFRIDFKDVIPVADIGQKPQKSSMKDFEEMIKPLRMHDSGMSDEERSKARQLQPWLITDDELEVLKEKTNRQIRLRELLQKYSMDAALVVMTLPMARKGTCSAGLYMSWLEELSRDMPPMLLMRGNQTSVLTFYS